MRKRVCINGRFLTQPIGGVQRYGIELVRGFNRLLASGGINKEQVEFELLVPPRPAARQLNLSHIATRVVGKMSGHVWEQWELPRFVDGHALLCLCNAAPIASLAGRTSTVVTIHDLAHRYFPQAYSRSYRLLYGILTPLIMRFATRMITVSASERASIVKHFPHAECRLTAIQNGTSAVPDVSTQDDSGPQKQPVPLVLYVGALNRRKNLQGVIDAFRKVKSQFSDVRLGIAGSAGAAFSEAGFTVPPEIIRDVDFFGQIDDFETLCKLYLRSRCLVFPSFFESSGLPPIEAMSCGCPVVASDIPSLRERCGDAALYCNPADPDDIADRILMFLKGETVYEDFRRRGREWARRYSWDECARDTFAIVNELLESSTNRTQPIFRPAQSAVESHVPEMGKETAMPYQESRHE